MNLKSSINPGLIAVMLTMLSGTAVAQGFSAGIAPSKFELAAKPGDVIRDTVLIMNAGNKSAGFSLRTSDWDITDNQGLEYSEDDLTEGSCRPWVRLERRDLTIRPSGQKRYRFEIHVPEDAPVGLCKFALLIEPAAPAVATLSGDQPISFPVLGRYAVIVYVTIGDAKANIEYEGLGRGEMSGLSLPALKLHNSGNTYDRVFGRISATDAAGERFVLIPSTFPVLPDHSEEILLVPEAAENGQAAEVAMQYPLQLKGTFEIGGQQFSVEEQFQ